MTCEELRAALDAAHAELDPPSRAATVVGAAEAPLNIDATATTLNARPDIWERIRSVEAALREAGCE
ncbi:MAG: hypothetical protein O3B31_07225 [Chloroflexi bacterium]|nr:hypothetical protein [Chloroflexota bacterium]MDA1003126.1 hypothetical protein [Chloroflexota bacterium]